MFSRIDVGSDDGMRDGILDGRSEGTILGSSDGRLDIEGWTEVDGSKDIVGTLLGAIEYVGLLLGEAESDG